MGDERVGAVGAEREREDMRARAEAVRLQADLAARAAAQARVAPVTMPPAPSPDGLEPAGAARSREAAAALSGAPVVRRHSNPGVEAARTLFETTTGLEERAVRLHTANAAVERAELRLGEQLHNLAPALSQRERQAFADSYRAQNAGVYAAARTAAEDLATYTRDSVPRIAEATGALPGHPMFHTVESLPSRAAQAVELGLSQLDTYVRQSPVGSERLSQTLGELAVATHAAGQALPNSAPGASNLPARVAVGTTGLALGQLGNTASRFADLAGRASGAFGVATGVLGGADAVGRLIRGEARLEHQLAAGVSAAQVGVGVARIAGVAVGATAGLGLTVAAGTLGAVSAYRDRQAYVRDVTATLARSGLPGIDGATAEALARSNPEALRRLEAAGFDPAQVRALSRAAPHTVRMHESSAASLAEAGGRLGMTPERTTAFYESLGERADRVSWQLARILGGQPGIDRAGILREMQSGMEATDDTRFALDLLR